jgi:hypothetical protein
MLSLGAPSEAPSETAGTPPRSPWARPPVRIAIFVVAAWALSALAYVLHATVILPFVILFGTASLLRGGRTLLDRLVFAVGILAGLTCVFGLLLSVWPFHLHPVPVAGLGLTALIVAAAAAGRRPNLPRPGFADLVTFSAVAVTLAVLAKPLVGGGLLGRVSFVTSSEDMIRHTSLFDNIAIDGGYLFLHQDQARQQIFEGMVWYPQGSHFLSVLLDNFLRSAAGGHRTALDAMDHYLIFTVAGFGLLLLAMLWAVQWLAGASLSPARHLVAVALVTALVVAGEPMSLLPGGYPSSVVGFALAVILIGVVVRPVPRQGQQVLTMAALLVGLAFTYYLLLPPIGLALLGWLVVHRKRVWKHKWLYLGAGVPTGLLAVAPPAAGLLIAGQAEALTAPGTIHPSRDLLIAMACVTGAALLSRAMLRTRTWPVYAWSLVSAGLLSVALFVEEHLTGTVNSYYANKTLFLPHLLLILGIGVVARRMPPPARRRIDLSLAGAALAALGIAAAFGFVVNDAPYHAAGTGNNYVWYWLHGARVKAKEEAARDILNILDKHGAVPAVPTLIIHQDPVESWTRTVFLSVLERTDGQMQEGLYVRIPVQDPGRSEEIANHIKGPILIVTESDSADEQARRIVAAHPDQKITVVRRDW